MDLIKGMGFAMGVVAWFVVMAQLFFFPYAGEDHTHEPTGVQVGSPICLEFGTLHYPDPIDGSDAHIDAAFCGTVVEGEGERFPPLGTDTHLAQ